MKDKTIQIREKKNKYLERTKGHLKRLLKEERKEGINTRRKITTTKKHTKPNKAEGWGPQTHVIREAFVVCSETSRHIDHRFLPTFMSI